MDARTILSAACAAWLALAACGAAGAADGAAPPAAPPPAIDFTGSGFLTLAAGKVLGGSHDGQSDQGYACPCFISDYAQGGVYESGRWRARPDSRLGLQGTAAFQGGRYSITGQAVARGARDGRVNLEWLYATAELADDWTLQAGRKRLPLFYSSEVQDVGYALPWTHLPPQLYGWDVVNYNGASISHRLVFGSWMATAQLLAGSETARDAGYWQIYNGKGSRTDSRWSQIAGAELRVTRAWFEMRAVLLRSTTSNRAVSAGETEFTPAARQRIHGLSFNADDGVWQARAEFLYIDRRQDYGFDHAQLLAVGRRHGSWSWMVSTARYRQTPNAGVTDDVEGHTTESVALRREIDRSSAVKLQLDRWRDHDSAVYTSFRGNARLLSVAYDKVF